MRANINGEPLENDVITELVSLECDYSLERGDLTSNECILNIEDCSFVINKHNAEELRTMLLTGIDEGFFDGLEEVK